MCEKGTKRRGMEGKGEFKAKGKYGKGDVCIRELRVNGIKRTGKWEEGEGTKR